MRCTAEQHSLAVKLLPLPSLPMLLGSLLTALPLSTGELGYNKLRPHQKKPEHHRVQIIHYHHALSCEQIELATALQLSSISSDQQQRQQQTVSIKLCVCVCVSAISEEWVLLNREKGCSASLALALPLTDHTAAAAAAVHWCMHYWRLIFSLALSSSFSLSLSTHSSLLGHCSRWSMIHSVSLSISSFYYSHPFFFPSV